MENEIALVIVTIPATLIGRYIWDRYISKSSRVTKEICELHMQQIENRLERGEETFKRIGSCITASCLIMLQLCEKAEINCSDIRQKMIDAGMNL